MGDKGGKVVVITKKVTSHGGDFLLTLVSEIVDKENGSIIISFSMDSLIWWSSSTTSCLPEDIDSILAYLVQEKGTHVVMLAYQVYTRTKY